MLRLVAIYHIIRCSTRHRILPSCIWNFPRLTQRRFLVTCYVSVCIDYAVLYSCISSEEDNRQSSEVFSLQRGQDLHRGDIEVGGGVIQGGQQHISMASSSTLSQPFGRGTQHLHIRSNLQIDFVPSSLLSVLHARFSSHAI